MKLAAAVDDLRIGRQARQWLLLRRARLTSGSAGDPVAMNRWFFDRLGIERAAAERRCAAALEALGHAAAPEGSIHYLAFAALAESGFAPATILELGTFRGEASEYLATLFPASQVVTVDVPLDDPVAAEFGPKLREARELAAGRLDGRPNVRRVVLNSMFLDTIDLPAPDLVWLDAGHHHPSVAWDHAYCLGRLRPGGWLLTDDVRLPDNPLHRHRPGSTDVHEIVEYWNARRVERFELLVKREDPSLLRVDPKFVGVVHQPAAGWSAVQEGERS